VIKLGSPDTSEGGEVVLLIEQEGQRRHTRVVLGPEDYRTAIQAHLDRARVRCAGELSREGRAWVVRHAREFARA